MNTRILIPLLTLAGLLTMPATAQVNYAVSGGTAYVTNSPNASGNVVIASTYNGYPVTSIGNRAFSSCSSLTSVTIPNSVTYIGEGAFSFCPNLTGVTIGNNVTIIEHGAFAYCTSLTSVTIPNGVTSIGSFAFQNCTSLTNFSVDAANSAYSSIDGVLFNKAQTTLIQFPGGHHGSYTIPSSVTSLGGYAAFQNCFTLTSVTIPNSVTNIGPWTFSGCTNLTSVTIPNSVTSIGSEAFSFCTTLTNFSVVAANSVYSSLDGVLFNKAQTTLIQFPSGRSGSYTVPSSVTSLGDLAFHSCTSLSSVTIGNSVTMIENNVFHSCTNLTSVTIPNHVTYIGYFAFFNCTSLTNFSVDAANSAYSSLDGVLFNQAQTQIIQFPSGRNGSYTVPNSVAYIADYAFYSSTRLTNVTFLGNAPYQPLYGGFNLAEDAEIYYYYGTTGWGPTFAGWPTMMLGAPAPQVGDGSAGVKPGGFGFALAGVVNQTIVVEASTNLVNWQPIWTSTLSAVSTNFVDPNWVNHPHRFYRLRSN